MKTLAAVLVETGKPLVLAELDIPVLKEGQALIEIKFSTVCHTQILEVRGKRGEDKFLPHGLGHEGSGVVLDVGPGVTKVKSGDRVLLSWMKSSGKDVSSTVYSWNGKNVNAGAITTFGKKMIISENRLTKLPDKISFQEAAFLGCAVPTGFGVVFNTAQAKAGQSAAVFGVGGIGLFAMAAASAAGCSPVIAIDVLPKKLEMAKTLGATHTIDASMSDVLAELKKLVPVGLDIAIEATGRPEVMKQAFSAVKDRGGTAVIVGNSPQGAVLELDPKLFNQGRRILGTWGGDNNPDRDFPRYFDLVLSKKLALDKIIGPAYRLDQINEAIDDLERGRAFRPLIDASL